MIAYWLIRYLVNAQSMFTALDIGSILSTIISVVLMVVATQQTRKAKGGFMSFGEAFKVSFLTYAIGSFIGVVFLYVFINFIDTNLQEIYIEASISISESMMRWFGTPEDVIMDAITQAEENIEMANITGIANFLIGTLQAVMIFGLPISAIIAAILKKKTPEVTA